MESHARKLKEVSTPPEHQLHKVTSDFLDVAQIYKHDNDDRKRTSTLLSDLESEYFIELGKEYEVALLPRKLEIKNIIKAAKKQTDCCKSINSIQANIKGEWKTSVIEAKRCNMHKTCRICAFNHGRDIMVFLLKAFDQLNHKYKKAPSHLECEELQNFNKSPVILYPITISPPNTGTIEDGYRYLRAIQKKLNHAIRSKGSKRGNKASKRALKQLQDNHLGMYLSMEFEPSEKHGNVNAHFHGLIYMKNSGGISAESKKKEFKNVLDYGSMRELIMWASGGQCSVKIGDTKRKKRPIFLGDDTMKVLSEVTKYITKMPVAGKDDEEGIIKKQSFIWDVFAKTKGKRLIFKTGELHDLKIDDEIDLSVPSDLKHHDLFNFDNYYAEKIYKTNEEYKKVAYLDRLKLESSDRELASTEMKLERMEVNQRNKLPRMYLKRRIKALNTMITNHEERIQKAELTILEKANRLTDLSTKSNKVGGLAIEYQEYKTVEYKKPLKHGSKKAELDALIAKMPPWKDNPNELPL
jgi:hypothetical protein